MTDNLGRTCWYCDGEFEGLLWTGDETMKADQVVQIPLGDVIPTPDNPRTIRRDDPEILELARPHPTEKGKAKKPKDADTPTKGICSVYGCTATTACTYPDGTTCHWTTPEQDLCSACAEQGKKGKRAKAKR